MPTNGAAAAEECEYRDDHPAIRVEIENLKKENESRKADEVRIFERLDGFNGRLSALEARVAGYVMAGAVLSAALGLLAKKVFGVG